MWLARLEANRPWIIEWLRHQTRDEFWKHGSVCENYADIEIPVYAMGGWADAYSNPVPRLLAGLSSPCKAVIGPWGHQYMHQAAPGPMMGYPDEALRWWDHWLKGADNGIMDEPAYRVWMQDSVPPRSHHPFRPGRWIMRGGLALRSHRAAVLRPQRGRARNPGRPSPPIERAKPGRSRSLCHRVVEPRRR